jgi:riboflavin kinase/FMN adenylyltransferase
VTVASDPAALKHEPRVAVIGNFDGVHLGHRAVVAAAAGGDLRCTAITFDPHPRSLFGSRVPLITMLDRRVELLHAAGAGDVLVLEFNAELAAMSPEQWLEQTLRPIGVQRVVVGSDLRFGRKRQGGLDTMRSSGFVVDPIALIPGTSSSRIRDLVEVGALGAAAAHLGRPVELAFDVVDRASGPAGAGRVELVADGDRYAIPPDGSYLARLGSVTCGLQLTRDPLQPALVRASARSAQPLGSDPSQLAARVTLIGQGEYLSQGASSRAA